MENAGITMESSEFKELRAINSEIWDLEDAIRIKEKNKEFDQEFIRIARGIYLYNDTRFLIKKQINLRYESKVVEEKEYSAYGGYPSDPGSAKIKNQV